MTETEYICHEKKEEEDWPVLKIVWMHKYEDSRSTQKKSKKRLIRAARKNTDNTWTIRTRKT